MAAENVKVIVRCRPMNNREISLKCKKVVEMDSERCCCSITNPNDASAPAKIFTFDGVYDSPATTEQIYNEAAYPLVEGVLEGYNSTVFAYGQTGCGKSFSMQGVEEPPSQRGIIPRAFEHIFEAISLVEDIKYLVLVSYLEIYNEEIRDLLSEDKKKKLELKENPERGVYVCDLSHHAVHDVSECRRLMATGQQNRSTGSTLMNSDSSRSHSIFTVAVEMMPIRQCLQTMSMSHCSIRRGKLSLVDLAGSERQAKTGATGDRLKEATKINLSLSALGNVISALVDGKAKHIPYRDSKLTRLLQDSLGGNTKTLMLACLAPSDYNYDETLSTLRYANRAKNIHNKPHINEDPKDTMLREYQQEIQKLRALLENNAQVYNSMNGSDALSQERLEKEEQERERERERVRVEYETEMERLRQQYEAELKSKCQMQSDLLRLREQYDHQLNNLNNLNHQTQLNGNTDDLIMNKALKSKPDFNAAQQEILKRLEKLQASMVGGERVHDEALRERRLRKKRAAERRLTALAQVLSRVPPDEDEQGPNLVLGVYDDIQHQLQAKTEILRKTKHKLKALEREITDIQSEFENERTDYLETIRKQERQIKLLSQILEKVVPTLRKECNYSNLDKIKLQAVWNEDYQDWRLPDLVYERTKFPPAVTGFQSRSLDGMTNQHKWSANGGDSDKSSRNSQLSSPDRNSSPERHTNEKEDEDFVGNYFKPKRAAELLSRAHEDSTKAFIHLNKQNRMNALISNSLNLGSNGFKNMSLALNNTNRAHSWSGGYVSPWTTYANGPNSPELHIKRPIRLQALLPLPVMDKQEQKISKPSLNMLDVI